MAKETMKAKIERLEQEKKADLERIMQLNQEILAMQEAADRDFENSTYKVQLEQQLATQADKAKLFESRFEQKSETNKELRNKIDELNSENKQLKAEISLLNEKAAQKAHNERNAGRKAKINEKLIAEMQMMRTRGMTIQAIQKETGLSYGLVQKYCKMVKN
ncbi:MAG: Hin recombinase [Firmicutes bacterium HGW-Firmicutes-2]|nr:MAG: Hin recombinase [Firmicutes bacterium HGW-Firmicutes-2]